jgi:hypothetical protein
LIEDDHGRRGPYGPVATPFAGGGQFPGGLGGRLRGRLGPQVDPYAGDLGDTGRRGRRGPIATPFAGDQFAGLGGRLRGRFGTELNPQPLPPGRRRGLDYGGPIAVPFGDEGGRRRRGLQYGGPIAVPFGDEGGRRRRGPIYQGPALNPLPADFPAQTAYESPNPDASPAGIPADLQGQYIPTQGGRECYVKVAGVWVQCQLGGGQQADQPTPVSYGQQEYLPTRKPAYYSE